LAAEEQLWPVIVGIAIFNGINGDRKLDWHLILLDLPGIIARADGGYCRLQ
jgi:hypothetical protein